MEPSSARKYSFCSSGFSDKNIVWVPNRPARNCGPLFFASAPLGTDSNPMKVRRLTRQYGFSGYSIYRYLVNETLHNGSYLLLWCEETAQAVASYWNASLEDVTRIVNGCIQVGLFNGELYEKHRILTSADIQRNYMDHVRSCGLLSRYPDIPKEFELSAS